VSRRDAEPDEREGLDATGPARVKNLTGDARGRIVVGVDGSDGADVALRWAVSEAKARHAGLELVTGWSYEPPDKLGTFEQRAKATIERGLAAVRAMGPDVEVTGRVVAMAGGEALIEESKDADMVVVGSRGRGGFTGLFLGSVSQQCAQHAHCPVVIIPRGDRTAM
jgi:nucleotide-binding universal stress UspA family protein